jgi:hypothetical protein
MRPLYDARVRDLDPGDFVKVECVCGHSELIPSSGLQQGLRLPPHPVLDLQSGSVAASAIGAGGSWCRSNGPPRIKSKFTFRRSGFQYVRLNHGDDGPCGGASL